MAHKDELIEGLQKLLKSDGVKRTKMGLVFEIYDTLLDLRNSGVSATDIETLLNDPAGVYKFDLPRGSLTSYMHRIKLKKAASDARRSVVGESVVFPKTKKPRKPKPVTTVAVDGEKSVPEKEIQKEIIGTVTEKRKKDSLKLAEKYSGKSADEEGNGVMKFL